MTEVIKLERPIKNAYEGLPVGHELEDGDYETYDVHNVLAQKFTVKDGKLTGEFIDVRLQGARRWWIEGTDAKCIYYWDRGIVKGFDCYLDGYRDKTSFKFRRDGKLILIANFKKGKRHGRFLHENGVIEFWYDDELVSSNKQIVEPAIIKLINSKAYRICDQLVLNLPTELKFDILSKIIQSGPNANLFKVD